MAPRDLMASTAMDTVFDNLGMDVKDLGLGDDDLGTDDDIGTDDDGGDEDLRAGADDHDFEDDADDDQDDDPFALADDRQDNQDRVSHTNGRRQPQRQSTRREQPPQLRAAQEARPDKHGNIVVNGKIVAKAGPQARIYMRGEKFRKQFAAADRSLRDTSGRLTKVTKIAERLYNENQTFAAQAKALKDLGMTPEDQISAMQLFTQLTKNPGPTLKKLLTRAAAQGINVNDATGGGANDVAAAVKELLGGELKPIKEFITSAQTREQQQQQLRQERAAVQEEVEDFFRDNPEAGQYHQVFSQVLRNPRFSKMSLGEIWARIQLNQARGGDLRTRRGRNANSRRGSPPQGRGMPPSGNSKMANVNDSYDSIVRSVLDEAGVQ